MEKQDLKNLQARINSYTEKLQNTINYRAAWDNGLKQELLETWKFVLKETEMTAEIQINEELTGLQSVTLDLGTETSGIAHVLSDTATKPWFKHNGQLIYQQIFNGKLQVLINFPFIEGYGEAKPPKMVGIFRPDELNEMVFLRQMEIFFAELSNWEDFDDDNTPPQKIGFGPSYSK